MMDDRQSFRKAQDTLKRNSGHPLILLLSALVVLVASSQLCANIGCTEGEPIYALIGAIIAFVVILVYLILAIMDKMEEFWEVAIFAFLFVWWGFYAGITTFIGPFLTPQNGYFGAWLGFFSATALLISKIRNGETFMKERIRDFGVKQGLVLVFAIVVIFAGAAACCSGLAILAMIIGSITVVIILLRLCIPFELRYLAIALCVMWLPSTLILTFGLFITVGNGYFGCWVCLICSLMMLSPKFGTV